VTEREREGERNGVKSSAILTSGHLGNHFREKTTIPL